MFGNHGGTSMKVSLIRLIATLKPNVYLLLCLRNKKPIAYKWVRKLESETLENFCNNNDINTDIYYGRV